MSRTLPGLVTAREIGRVLARKPHANPQRIIPAVRDVGERRIKRRAQRRHYLGQRIGEVFVFTASEAMPCHHHTASKQRVRRVARSKGCALLRGQQPAGRRAAVGIELRGDARPIDGGNLRGERACGGGRRRLTLGGKEPGHTAFSRVNKARLRATPHR